MEAMAVASSGSDVPMATSEIPMASSDMPRVCARVTPLRTSRSLPVSRAASPRKKNNKVRGSENSGNAIGTVVRRWVTVS